MLAKCAELVPINTDDLSPVQFKKYVISESALPTLYRSLTRMKQSPLPLLVNLGPTPEEATACVEMIRRIHEASIPFREGFDFYNAGQKPQAKKAFQKAYKLNPHDRDAALFLGLSRPRLRTKADLPLD